MNLPARAQKLLPLALSPSAADGEWRNAAQLFFKLLREEGMTVEQFMAGGQGGSIFGSMFNDDMMRRYEEAVRRERQPQRASTSSSWTHDFDDDDDDNEDERLAEAARKRATIRAREYPLEPACRRVILKFGKHKFKLLHEVPLDYLQWMVRNTQKETLKNYVREEINWRLRGRRAR